MPAAITRTKPDVLTVSQLATRLQVCEATVRRWAKRGDIDAFVLPGGGLRFSAVVVDAMFNPELTEHESYLRRLAELNAEADRLREELKTKLAEMDADLHRSVADALAKEAVA
jgi:transposase-like protein